MDDPKLNPYQSPAAIEPRHSLLDREDPQSVAMLHARIEQLERQLKANWFFGAMWKRMLAVVGYFLLAYLALVLVVVGFMASIDLVRMLGPK